MNELEELRKEFNTRIDKLLKKDEPKFEVGKWYKTTLGSIYFINKIEGKRCHGFGSSYGTWHNQSSPCATDQLLRLATPSEVELALIEEAKRRGFDKGVKFYSAKWNDGTMGDSNNINWKYIKDEDQLNLNGENGIVYFAGKWAEIIPQEEKIKIGGYEVEFEYGFLKNNYTKVNHTVIDGHLFTTEFWHAAKLISENSKACVKVGFSKQFDVDLQTINKILDKLK